MSTVLRFPKQQEPNSGSDDPNALCCEWCGKWVAPIGRNIDGRGYTYLRDEEGDLICPDCLLLPPYFVRAGNA